MNPKDAFKGLLREIAKTRRLLQQIGKRMATKADVQRILDAVERLSRKWEKGYRVSPMVDRPLITRLRPPSEKC